MKKVILVTSLLMANVALADRCTLYISEKKAEFTQKTESASSRTFVYIYEEPGFKISTNLDRKVKETDVTLTNGSQTYVMSGQYGAKRPFIVHSRTESEKKYISLVCN
jgi:hypothetical protein